MKFLWCVFLSVSLSSCLVTQQKYNLLLENRNRLENQNLRLEQTVRKQKSGEDVSNRQKEIIDNLNQEKQQAQSRQKAMEDQIVQLTSELKKSKEENEMLQTKVNNQENTVVAKVSMLPDSIENMTDSTVSLSQLREELQIALEDFSNTDLRIEEKDQKVFIALPQNLLFAVGSATIDSTGYIAIARLFPVLEDYDGVQITVEGHTDPDGAESRNWDLSVMRATAVVKQLIQIGVAGKRITAAGRAFHDPIVPNDTYENKAKNRRIEIILDPYSKET